MSISSTLYRLKLFLAEIISALSYFVFPHPKATSWAMHRKLRNPSWYHDFSMMGVETRLFPADEYRLSQEDKQSVLFWLLQRAGQEYVNAEVGMSKTLPTMVDLFCADAFYSIYALKMNLISRATGIDLEQQAGEGKIRMGVLQQAATIRTLTGLDGHLDLLNSDVMSFSGMYDICLCAGGLYHISNPALLIERITRNSCKLLIIQTVIPSHISESSPFFVTPAPHWTWGSRFNLTWLEQVLTDNSWEILEKDIRPMRANTNDWDRLSLSLLCVKSRKHKESTTE